MRTRQGQRALLVALLGAFLLIATSGERGLLRLHGAALPNNAAIEKDATGGGRPPSEAGFVQSQQAAPAAAPHVGYPNFESPQAQPIGITPDNSRVYVANTPADSVDVIETRTGRIVARIDVGIDPVGIAVRPDGREIWVTNHVSDSVSVIDSDPTSLWYHHVVATV